jgi:hypothetical protein
MSFDESQEEGKTMGIFVRREFVVEKAGFYLT